MMETLNRDCECWDQTVSLKFANQNFPKEALRHIYCPKCSKGIRRVKDCMTEDKGWVIEYDPNLIRSASTSVRVIQDSKTPGSLQVYMETGRRLRGVRHLRP